MLYSYTPSAHKRRGVPLSLLCFVVGAALFVPLRDAATVQLVMRCVAPLAFFCGIVTVDRFLILEYTYSLSEDSSTGETVFSVTERRFSRCVTVCCVTASSVKAVVPAGGRRSAYRPAKGTKRYSYCPGILLRRGRLALLVEDGDGCSEVLILADNGLKRALDALCG